MRLYGVIVALAFCFVLSLGCSTLPHSPDRPEWTTQPKSDDSIYMYRVGHASAQPTPEKARQAAYSDALAQISKSTLSSVRIREFDSTLTSDLEIRNAEIMPGCIYVEKSGWGYNCWVQVCYPLAERAIMLDKIQFGKKYPWREEFIGRNVLVFCVYSSDGNVVAWSKMYDEVVTFLQGLGATVQKKKRVPDLHKIVEWSSVPEGTWNLEPKEAADFVVLMVASGNLNRRKSSKNPLGADYQFAGEIRTIVHKGRNPYFSDRYRGVTGWNPMGEQMCMEVLALNVMKTWKVKYLKHLGVLNVVMAK